jgi:Viral coat protein P2 N-terminal domain
MAATSLRLQPFTNVVNSGIAVTDLRHLFGYGIQRLILNLGGTTFTKSMITGLQLKANSKVIVDTDGSKMDARNLYRGISASANFLTLDFMELFAKSKLGMESGTLDTTVGMRDLRLEVTTTGATAPTLQGVAEVTTPQVSAEYQAVRPLIARVHRATQTIGAGGEFSLQIPHLDPNAGGSIFKRIAIFSANMTACRVERNGVRELDIISKAFNDFNQAEYKRVPQAGLFMLDFLMDGILEGRLLDTRPAAGCTTCQVYGTFSAGETVTIEVETLEPLDVY